MMLIKKELKSSRWKFIVFFGLLLIMAITIIIQYPFIKNFLEQGVMEGMPEWMVKGAAQQTNFNVYLSANWFDKNLIQISFIFALLFGMSVISSEVENHTIEFLLTRPYSRVRIFIEKTGIQLIGGLLIMGVTTYILGLTSLIQNYDVNLLRLMFGVLPLFVKFFIIYSLSLFLSLFLDDQVKAGISAALVLLFFWGADLLWDISIFNIFGYAPVTPFYTHGIFTWAAVIKLFVIGLILYGGALYRFKTRDF